MTMAERRARHVAAARREIERMQRQAPVCDMCLDAAEDEGIPSDEAAAMMRLLGADVADHLCDAVEIAGVRCGCGCQRR